MKKLLKGLDAGVFTTCNIVFFSELVRYEEADNNCKNFDIGSGRAEEGNLATVNDEEKNTDLKLLLQMAYPAKHLNNSVDWTATGWVWAGLRKTKDSDSRKDIIRTKEGSGKWIPENWEWADGSNPTDYENWRRKQPDQRTAYFGEVQHNTTCDEKPVCLQKQMRINHKGEWDDTFKQMKHPYACDYQGKYILSNEPKTWVDAKGACADAGLSLAMIRNAEEVDEMKAAMKYFLGEADSSWKRYDARNWVWLGGNDLDEEGIFKWLNGDLVETWDIPWQPKAGGDNAGYLKGTDLQHILHR